METTIRVLPETRDMINHRAMTFGVSANDYVFALLLRDVPPEQRDAAIARRASARYDNPVMASVYAAKLRRIACEGCQV